MSADKKYTRILVCGGRDYSRKDILYGYLDWKATFTFRIDATIIHGAAAGADRLAGAWGIERGFCVEPYPANWNDLDHPEARIKFNRDGKKYNANAGPIRNKRMLVEGRPDLVIAFPGGRGTDNMIMQTRNAINEVGVPKITLIQVSTR